jgi:copper oxidase (laccase) domain-containing protein
MVQAQDVGNALWGIANCCPVLLADRVSGVFSVAHTGELLTVRMLREGKEWMQCNLRQNDQRWAGLISIIAVLGISREQRDRQILEQFESLVQPTQFLEYLCKTMPMSEAQLDIVTTMHDTLQHRLNALEVLFKGGQPAVDEFMSSWLTWMDKLKASAVAKGR